KPFNVSVTGPLGGPVSPNGGGIVGDVCIGPNTILSITGQQAINGDILLAAGATIGKDSTSGHVGNVLTNQNLAPEIQGCQAAGAPVARPRSTGPSSLPTGTSPSPRGWSTARSAEGRTSASCPARACSARSANRKPNQRGRAASRRRARPKRGRRGARERPVG